jgi:polyhydroxyalkanoate synthase
MASGVVAENQIARGRVTIGDRVAALDKIKSSLLAFAGEKDILVPPEVARSIVDVVATKDAEFRVSPGGHMGVIIGSKAQGRVWEESAQWLAQRSGAKQKPKARPKAKRRAT